MTTESNKGKLLTTRRGLLAGGGGVAVLGGMALWRRGLEARNIDEDKLPAIVPPKVSGRSSHIVPNVRVVGHDGKERLFYDDLIYNKVVAINFMSTRGDEAYPVMDNLVQISNLLCDRMGKDLFFVSVTTSPAYDTPEKLAEFAEKKGVLPGHTLVSGGESELEFIKNFLFVRRPTGLTANPLQGAHGPCCSVGLVRYGNEAAGRWASFPAKIKPEMNARRFGYIGFRKGDAPVHA